MKLLKLSTLERDVKAEVDGEWVPVKRWAGLDPDEPYAITELPDVSFYVRSVNYQPYRIARQKMVERFEEMKKSDPDKEIPDEIIEAENGKLMADHLLLGWAGLDVEYTPDVADATLTKPSASIHRQMVMLCASKVGKRKAEFVEEAAKN